MQRLMLVVCGLLAAPVMALDLQAKLQWSERTELGTLVSGIVETIEAVPGEAVSRGDILLSLDQREFKAALRRARALYARAKERFDEAKREDERAMELYDKTLLSDHERQLAIIELVESRALLEKANADVTDAVLALERSELRAPYDGVVISRNVSVGEVVVSELQSAPLLIVANNQQMLAQALLDAQQANAHKRGAEVKVAVGEQWYPAVIHMVGLEPAVESDKGPLYRLQTLFTPPGDILMRAGEQAVIRIGE